MRIGVTSFSLASISEITFSYYSFSYYWHRQRPSWQPGGWRVKFLVSTSAHSILNAWLNTEEERKMTIGYDILLGVGSEHGDGLESDLHSGGLSDWPRRDLLAAVNIYIGHFVAPNVHVGLLDVHVGHIIAPDVQVGLLDVWDLLLETLLGDNTGLCLLEGFQLLTIHSKWLGQRLTLELEQNITVHGLVVELCFFRYLYSWQNDCSSALT